MEFRLMVYLSSRSFYFDVLNVLHRGVERKFREAGITFAIPQRAVHMRSSESGSQKL